MNSSVYQVVGCYGSQKLRECEKYLSADEAKKKARKWNQANADCLGISLREYNKRTESNMEGKYFAARSGKHGQAYETQNLAASALGKLARGKKKTISEAERQARRDRMAKARENRWKKKEEK